MVERVMNASLEGHDRVSTRAVRQPGGTTAHLRTETPSAKMDQTLAKGPSDRAACCVLGYSRKLEGLRGATQARIFENAQRQLAASALNPTSNEETLDDRDEELKRAHHLMMQAQELFGTGNVEGAIANIKEVGRIKKRYPER